jgi:hypothetical protein
MAGSVEGEAGVGFLDDLDDADGVEDAIKHEETRASGKAGIGVRWRQFWLLMEQMYS